MIRAHLDDMAGFPTAGRWNQAIASSGDGFDVASVTNSVAERLAHPGNGNPQAAVLYRGVRPGMGKQFRLADNIAPPLGQQDQDIDRPGAELDRFAVPEQKPPARE